jgi:nitrogen-specific signal transduction histidine kinase
MNQFFPSVSTCGQDALLGRIDLTSAQIPNCSSTGFEELAHELRQPLGVIESLAYFLEITAEDEQLCGYLQRIQSMVLQANRILDRHSGLPADGALDSAALLTS